MTQNDITRIRHFVATDQLQEAIQLLMQSNSKNVLEEAVQYSGRLHFLYKQIRLGLISYENQQLTQNQIRYAILQMLAALENNQRPAAHVLVAGTGQYELPADVYWIAASLGRALAENDFKLVVGGWPGVDYVVAEAFAKTLQTQGNDNLSSHLVQVVREKREPEFKGGNMLLVKEGLAEWFEALKYSDLVVLIGGEGGTYETFVYANQESIPVIPIASTGGDASRALDFILQNWATWEKHGLPGIKKHELAQLILPVCNEEEATKTVEQVITLLQKLTK